MTRTARWLRGAVLLASLAGAGCGPSVNVAACSNDADCKQADEDLQYCVNHRCVECVTSSACESRERCSEGRCVDR